MEIKFFSAGKIMDLSGQKVSVSESNSKVSDKISTKYLFPFEFYMDEEFKKTFGDYSSYDSYNLPKMIDGQLLYENIYRIAKLESCELLSFLSIFGIQHNPYLFPNQVIIVVNCFHF